MSEIAPRPLVLVHGAWQDASTWDLLVPLLRRAGRHVVVPPFTGLEGDPGELTDSVTLDTHIDDVAGVLEREDVRNAVLVGHSYAGMIITGVAERARDRLSHLVYVDAFVPEDGQSALDLMAAPFREAFRQQAAANGGWRLPAGERQLDLWGLEEGPAREFVRGRLTDFTIRCFEQPLRAPTHAATSVGRTYVACVREGYPARVVFEPFARKARAEGWSCHELASGHDCHVEQPEALARVLLGILG